MVKKTPALRVNSLNIDTAVTAAQTQPNLSRQLTKAHRPGQSRMVTYLSINLIDRPFSTNVSRGPTVLFWNLYLLGANQYLPLRVVH